VRASERYDDYWRARDLVRSRARSEARATLALSLLRRAGISAPGAGGRRLLDVGCGPGWALERFVAAGYDASGLDVSDAAAEAARSKGLSVEVGDIEDGALPSESEYDILVALEVLEHLTDPLGALLRLTEALAPGGHLVVSLPNEFHLLRRVGVLFGRPACGGHDDPHLRYFDDRRARRLFAAASLRVLYRRADGLAPPRFAFLRQLARPAVSVFPGLFALSNIYLLSR